MDRVERAWVLMARALSEEASERELSELDEILSSDPSFHAHYEYLKSKWTLKGGAGSMEREDAKLQRIIAKAEYLRSGAEGQVKRPLIKRLLTRWTIAASIVIGSFFVYRGFVVHKNANVAELVRVKVVAAKVADKREVRLPDGSIVILNSDSKLSYNPDFNGKTREVVLEGEAYFDVTKQPNKPFIVHAGGIKVKVLGTAFNIKNYKDERNIETTLLRGQIEVTGLKSANGKPLIMHPNQKLIVPQKEQREQIETKEPAVIEPLVLVNLDASLKQEERKETSWMYNRFEFRGEDFQSLAKNLERRLKIKIHFLDEESKSIRFNGSFENESPDQVFLALQKVAQFSYKINYNEVYIKSEK